MILFVVVSLGKPKAKGPSRVTSKVLFDEAPPGPQAANDAAMGAPIASFANCLRLQVETSDLIMSVNISFVGSRSAKCREGRPIIWVIPTRLLAEFLFGCAQ